MKTADERAQNDRLAERISKVVSEILSDRYDAKITVVFKPKDENEDDKSTGEETK